MSANLLQTVKADNRAGLETVSVLHLETNAQKKNWNWHMTMSMTDNGCEFNTVKQLIVKELGLKVSE